MLNKKAPDYITKFLEGVVGMVEANRYESMCIWQEIHEQYKKSWEQSPAGGYGISIGHYNNRPIFISLFINIVDGYKILFWEATSQLVDHKMIDDWFKANLPLVFKENSTDASNFVNILHHLNWQKKMNEIEEDAE